MKAVGIMCLEVCLEWGMVYIGYLIVAWDLPLLTWSREWLSGWSLEDLSCKGLWSSLTLLEKGIEFLLHPSDQIRSLTLDEKYRSFNFAFLTRRTAAWDFNNLSVFLVLFSIGGALYISTLTSIGTFSAYSSLVGEGDLLIPCGSRRDPGIEIHYTLSFSC